MSINELTSPGEVGFAGIARFPASVDLLEKLPLAIYACDADGRIAWFNSRAAELWGRQPLIGDHSEKYCGSHKLFFDGRPIARDETPMARVLRTGVPVRGTLGRVERPDGSSVWAMVHIEPLKDADGHLIGAINCFHDVSEQVRAAELLHEQEQRLSVANDHAGIGIAEVDAEGKLIRVNAHLASLLGIASEKLLGRWIFDAGLTENPDYDQEQFRRQVSGEIGRYTTEKCFRRPDGTKLWVSITSSSVCDSDGKFLYAVRIQQNVTARKVAEAALALRAEEQAALFELTDALQGTDELKDVYEYALNAILRALRCERAAILLSDESGAMKFQAWRHLSDVYRHAVEGHSPWQHGVIDPEPVCVENIETAVLPDTLKATVKAEGIGAVAFIPLVAIGRLIGKFMVYYDRAHAFPRSEIDLALTIARQLGWAIERVRAENLRQQAERAAQQLAAIVQSSHDAIVSKDLEGIIQTWNFGAERLFGYRAEEVVGKPITILIPPERLHEEPAILARIRKGELVDHVETVRRRKDGSLIDISLTISPVRNNDGKIIGASKVARDISERKQAEVALRDGERRLKELLAAIPAAIYTTDEAGRITYYNEAAVEFAGRRPTIGSDEWCVSWKLYWPDGTPLPHDQNGHRAKGRASD